MRNRDWECADCFACGTIATLAELQGNNRLCHLRCDANWEYRRVKCIYCRNENPQTLGALFADESRQQRSAQTCEVCHGYVKMIAAFSPNPPELLAAQDFATLHLDFIAQKKGSARTGSVKS